MHWSTTFRCARTHGFIALWACGFTNTHTGASFLVAPRLVNCRAPWYAFLLFAVVALPLREAFAIPCHKVTTATTSSRIAVCLAFGSATGFAVPALLTFTLHFRKVA
jgi:hypothetical protein